MVSAVLTSFFLYIRNIQIYDRLSGEYSCLTDSCPHFLHIKISPAQLSLEVAEARVAAEHAKQKALEEKIASLEALLQAKVAPVEAPVPKPSPSNPGIEQLLQQVVTCISSLEDQVKNPVAKPVASHSTAVSPPNPNPPHEEESEDHESEDDDDDDCIYTPSGQKVSLMQYCLIYIYMYMNIYGL